MATTKLWPVYDSLRRVLDYANNPEKTEYSSLRDVIHYAENGEKTMLTGTETVYLTTAVNCEFWGDTPLEAMQTVQNHFGNRGSIVAFHAYQSFRPGEITPEECHKIGVFLAQTAWDRHQVMVATHLNCGHLHNHFIINPISHIDGKKLDSGYKLYWDMRSRSDILCKQFDKSVIKNPKGKTPRNIYFAEKNGQATKYSLMREAIEKALELSVGWSDFEQHLCDQGYQFYRNEGRKYPTIKRINDTKATRIYQLGDEYTLDYIQERLEENHSRFPFTQGSSYGAYYYMWQNRNGYYRKTPAEYQREQAVKQLPPLLALLVEFIYLIGGPDLVAYDNPSPKYYPITPEMRETTRKLEMYSRQAIIMGREKLGTKEDVDDFLERTETQIVTLERKRKDLYNTIRRETDQKKIESVKQQISAISAELKPLRRTRTDMKKLLERSGVMKEQIEAEHKARREYIERNYKLTSRGFDEIGIPRKSRDERSDR